MISSTWPKTVSHVCTSKMVESRVREPACEANLRNHSVPIPMLNLLNLQMLLHHLPSLLLLHQVPPQIGTQRVMLQVVNCKLLGNL